MKHLNVLISVFVLLLISEPLIGGQQDAKHLRVFGAINPTIKRYPSDGGIYSVGIAYQPKGRAFSIGIDLMLTTWHSNTLYKIEKGWLYPNQSIGVSDDIIFAHSTIGFAPNIGVKIGENAALWSGSLIQVGLNVAAVESPNGIDTIDNIKPTSFQIISPYIRLTRLITLKLPLVVVGQGHYVPSVGLVTQFMLGLNLDFFE